MSATIAIKNSTVPGRTPASLALGEIAINVPDGKIYVGTGTSVKLLSESGSTGGGGGGGGTVTSVQLTQGTGISLSGTNPITTTGNITITNTAPDQTVGLSNGTGISVMGTYPNFTVTNTSPDQTVTLNNGTGISVTGTYPNFTITNTSLSTLGGYLTTSSFNNYTSSNTAKFAGTSSYATTASYALNGGGAGLSGGTDMYIPLWSGSNALTSSLLNQSGSVLKTITESIDKGLYLDFINNKFAINNGGTFGQSSGLNIDINSDNYSLGRSGYDGDPFGLVIKPAGITLGDPGGNVWSNARYLDIGSNYFLTFNDNTITGGDRGIKLDFSNKIYQLGDYGDVDNTTKIVVNDTAQIILLSGSVDISGSLTVTNGISGQIITTKAGLIESGDFSGNPLIYIVNLTTPYPDTNYTVTVTAENDVRIWTVNAIETDKFTINSNSSTPLTGKVRWMAVPHYNS